MSVEKKDYKKERLKELQDKQMRFITKATHTFRTDAVLFAPKDTGNLANSIETREYVEDGSATGEIESKADYSVYVEYGTGIHAKNNDGRKTPWVYYSDRLGRYVLTRGQEAQPFMEPAAEELKKKLPKLESELKV